MNLPRKPVAYFAPMPMDALAKTPEELLPQVAAALKAYFKRVATSTATIAAIHRSDAIWVCGTRTNHGKTAKTAMLRLAFMLGVPEEDLHLQYVKDLRWNDGRANRDYSVYVGDLSKRQGNPGGTNITVFVVSRKYTTCWYGTCFPFERLEGVPPLQQAGNADDA